MIWIPVEAVCELGHRWEAMAPIREWPGQPGRLIVGPLDDVRPDCTWAPLSDPERRCGARAWGLGPASPERLERWREDLLGAGGHEQPVRHRNG